MNGNLLVGKLFQRKAFFILPWAFLWGVLAPVFAYAHQQPTTLVFLDVGADKVSAELEIPLTELELAFGHDASNNADTLLGRAGDDLKNYILARVRPVTGNQKWTVRITKMEIGEAEQTQSGAYQEVNVFLDMIPPAGVDPRAFTLDYDVIMHQVVTHKAIVSVRSDFEGGVVGEHPVAVGPVFVDTGTGEIAPLEVNLVKGSAFAGFRAMVGLGIGHIREGTDHLLFLLVLLLPAPLLFGKNNRNEFGGSKYTIARLLKIVTAFTAGHSLTLLIGALNLFQVPQQPVEILIAVSILISAVHAIRPIFSGREMFVAGGFGLVHGLAFATVLSNLNLTAGKTALSILGFNIGIELMQLFVVALVAPWLILLALTPFYKYFRISGASLAGIASIAWIVERVSGDSNFVTGYVQHVSEYAHLVILALAVVAVAAYGLRNFKNKSLLIPTRQ